MGYINTLVNTFGGISHKTIAIPVSDAITISEFWEALGQRLPLTQNNRLILTTTSNKQLPTISTALLSTYLTSPQDDLLPLRLSVPLCGGKGGFGSQLRAAGGRMSSRKKRKDGDENGSSRNLDGRRLRTVTEAKALAEYLTIKPEMEREEKEIRRRKWQQIIAMAEKRESDIRRGGRGKLDGKWVDDKEEANERTRDAVLAAMKAGTYQDNLAGSLAGPSSSEENQVNTIEESYEAGNRSDNSTSMSEPQEKDAAASSKPKAFFGFDEDDEFMSSDDEDVKQGK